MTPAQAMTLIETAAGPADLFGADARRDYRALARLTHPDAQPGEARAAAAFARLAQLWREHCAAPAPGAVAGAAAFAGDIADLHEHERGLLKVVRDPADNDLMDAEAAALTRIHRCGDDRARPYVPVLAGCQRRRDPATGAVHRANVLGRLDGFVTLADVAAAYPGGLDPRDAAWMWRRLLAGLGFVHRAGVVHAAVVPGHVLVHPAQHGLVLVDWCYAVTAGDRAAAVPARYQDWYPPELRSGRPPGPDLDIWLATRCMTRLMGAAVPAPLAAFARGCTLTSPAARPCDAWAVLAELDELLERLYGRRTYRPLKMPA